jgi:hypothetical protein
VDTNVVVPVDPFFETAIWMCVLLDSPDDFCPAKPESSTEAEGPLTVLEFVGFPGSRTCDTTGKLIVEAEERVGEDTDVEVPDGQAVVDSDFDTECC